MPGILNVFLNSKRVGTINNIPGNYNIFVFDPEYAEDSKRPVLSQSLIDKNEDVIRIIPRTHTASPPFFANLLPEPESLLRRIIARQNTIRRLAPDFPFLRLLGRDLPGAVRIEGDEPSGDAFVSDDGEASNVTTIRFSLAGVQLKFSASMAGDRFLIDEHGAAGTWIVKLPTNAYARLPENEFAVMSLARAVGLAVPPIELRPLASIPDVSPFIAALRSEEDKVFAIERFDRPTGGPRLHVEDFNQVAAQKPADKYEHRTTSYIAKVISQICEPADLDEFVRRLIFGICVGNDDMHLKNWALSYPDGRHARIAPLYDFVFTRLYLPDGGLALTVGGKRRVADMTFDTLRAFAAQAEISEKRVAVLAVEMTEKIRSAWPRIKETVSYERFSIALEHHFDQVPIMNGSPSGSRRRSMTRRSGRA
jgi:serine/threonine-protein kinase HipA